MPEWSEEDIVLVSAIEHFSYCPRQCGLIHIENVFDENIFTLRGRQAHERVDEADAELRDGCIVECALPLWSDRLGLQGKADVVEFHSDGTVFPVEYKFGRHRAKVHDDLQICAQALCLEEMLDLSVPKGAIYYYSSRRRREVEFTSQLRAETERVIQGIRLMQREGVLPPPVDDARCPDCSLVDACLPSALNCLRQHAGSLYVPVSEEYRS